MTAARVLSDDDWSLASSVGRARWRSNRQAGRRGKFPGDEATLLRQDMDGASAERAVALELGVPWDSALKTKPPKMPDVPPDWQVRTTRRRNGCLAIQRAEQTSAHRFVLVIAAPPLFTIVGWLRGRDVPSIGTWRTDLPFPCWFVAQNALCDWVTADLVSEVHP